MRGVLGLNLTLINYLSDLCHAVIPKLAQAGYLKHLVPVSDGSF